MGELRKCKWCSVEMVTQQKRNRYCSKQCGFDARKNAPRKHKLVTVSCAVCQASIKRKEIDLQIREQFACSANCQRVIAGWAGRNHRKASRLAKSKWRKQESARRRKANKWIQLCIKERSGLSKPGLTNWETKCRNAAMTLKKRNVGATQARGGHQPQTWTKSITQNLARLGSVMRQRQLSTWEARCSSAACSLRKRSAN